MKSIFYILTSFDAPFLAIFYFLLKYNKLNHYLRTPFVLIFTAKK